MEVSKLHYSIFFITIIFVVIFITADNAYAQTLNDSSTNGTAETSDILTIQSNTAEGNGETLQLPVNSFLFNVTPHNDENGKLISLSLSLKDGYDDLYKELGLFDKPRDIVFIYPSFTQAAYGTNGFYDFYHDKCDSKCLTVPMPTGVHGFQSSSIAGAWALKLLNYPYVKDQDVDQNPDILKQYKRVIVLHNEYVTKKEFDAITSHPDVIFLYPNALYAEVQANYSTNTITLVHGHGYPDSSVKNGFDWKYDNSKYEYNVDCNNWNFYKAGNDSMLNCYPEYKLLSSEELLRLLQNPDPTDLLNDLSNWLRYPDIPSVITKLLNDYDISGKHIPSWVSKSVVSTLNGDISKSEFGNLLRYLYDQKLLN